MAKAKVPFKYQSVVDAIAAKLKELPEGTETCTTGYGNALWKVAFYGAGIRLWSRSVQFRRIL